MLREAPGTAKGNDSLGVLSLIDPVLPGQSHPVPGEIGEESAGPVRGGDAEDPHGLLPQGPDHRQQPLALGPHQDF